MAKDYDGYKVYTKHRAYDIVMGMARPCLRFFLHMTIVNKEMIPKEGAAVIAGNHRAAIDPALVNTCTKRVVHTLAKKALVDSPMGFFFKAGQVIPVDQSKEHNHAALDTAVEYLKAGYLINVSPEGKRNRTDAPLLPEFKYGAVVMAQRTGVPIVPYAITGGYKLFGKNRIEFGEPFSVEGMDRDEANKKLYGEILALVEKGREIAK